MHQLGGGATEAVRELYDVTDPALAAQFIDELIADGGSGTGAVPSVGKARWG